VGPDNTPICAFLRTGPNVGVPSARLRVSGKAVVRTGLRMILTIPLPPLKFCAASFLRHGAKTLPELRHFFGRKRHDGSPVLFEAEAHGYGAAGPTITKGSSRLIAALEVDLARGNSSAGVEAVAAVHYVLAMIHGLWRGLRMLLELMADVISEGRIGHLGNRCR